MLLFKKLFFSIPFLALFYYTIFESSALLKDIYFVFNFNQTTLLTLIFFTLALSFSSLFFIIFTILADNWRLTLPVVIIALIAPLIFLPFPISLIILGGFLISFLVTIYRVSLKLKTYIDFQVVSLFNPLIKSLVGFAIFTLAFGLFFKADSEIKQQGFKIPDQILDAAINIAQPQVPVKESSLTQIFPSNESIKNLLNTQLQKMVEPYLGLIPVVLALVFYFTLQSFFFIVAIFMPLFLALIFWILEKVNFIKYSLETREIRKIIL